MDINEILKTVRKLEQRGGGENQAYLSWSIYKRYMEVTVRCPIRNRNKLTL